MDRQLVLGLGAIVVLLAAWLTKPALRDDSAPRLPNLHLDEPRRLNIEETTAQPLRRRSVEEVCTIGFPGNSPSSANETTTPILNPAELTPSLAAPQNGPVALPSAGAIPAPYESTVERRAIKAPIIDTAQGAEPFIGSPLGPVADVAATPSALPTVTERPAALAAAVNRAERMTADGVRLLQRGAVFSARSQFLQALREVASAQDEIHTTARHTQSLNAALKAIEESHDFELHNAADNDAVDVSRLIAVHRSNAVSLVEGQTISPVVARDHYQLFAVEQLVAAFGQEPMVAMPLFGLGRVAAAQQAGASSELTQERDAFVWFHAALMTNPSHFPAAHELGALYAKHGELPRAKAVLQRAVALYSHPITWSNLAHVHRQLGEADWAAAAQSRAAGAKQIAATAKLPPIQWVNEEQFAKTNGLNEPYFPKQPQSAAPQPTQEPAARSAAKPAPTSWLPWTTRKR